MKYVYTPVFIFRFIFKSVLLELIPSFNYFYGEIEFSSL